MSMASYNYASILFIFFLLSLLAVSNQSDMMQLVRQIAEKVGKIEIKLDELKKVNEDLKDEIGKMKENSNELKKEKTKKDDGKTESADLNGQIDGIIAWKTTYKWNASDCGQNLIISEDGLIAKYSGPSKWSTVRATLPIPAYNLTSKKPSIAFFYEVEILVDHSSTSSNYDGIVIGFCVQEFPLEYKYLGLEDSIGIWGKEIIWIDGTPDQNWKRQRIVQKKGFCWHRHYPSAELENGMFCYFEWLIVGEGRIANEFRHRLQPFPGCYFEK